MIYYTSYSSSNTYCTSIAFSTLLNIHSSFTLMLHIQKLVWLLTFMSVVHQRSSLVKGATSDTMDIGYLSFKETQESATNGHANSSSTSSKISNSMLVKKEYSC